MFRKIFLTFLLIFILLFVFMIPKKETIISAFRISNEPLVISKGNYGQSLIVEISFSHDGINEWIEQLNKPYPLFMLEANWIERSPETVELLKKKNIPTGLYGKSGEEFSIDIFNKEVDIYVKHFKNKPLWYMTSDYKYSQDLRQAAFNEQINLLSPTFIYSKENQSQNKNGSIISIQVHENNKPNFQDVTKFINSNQFISIEENIFGYKMKSKKSP